MKQKLILLILALFMSAGAWAQLTSISDGGLYNIQFCRTNLSQDPLKVKSNLYHDVQNNYDNTIAAVFKFETTGEANTYYIKEFSSTQYVYAYETTASTGSSQTKIKLGKTTLPGSDSATPEESLSRYKWVISYVGTKGTGTFLWTIKPKENTEVYWSVYGQRASNPVALYGTNTDGYDHYVLGFVQFITPTIASCIEANCKVLDITGLGYSKDDIAEYYKPTKLDVAGWPTTEAYNTFKTAINALADDAVINTAYETPYNTMCTSYVLPEVGKFYTIYQPVAGKYIHAVTPDYSTNLAASTDGTTASAIFYIPASRHFISYSNGYAMVENKIYNGTYGSGGYQTYTIDHLLTHPLGTLRIKGSNFLAADAGNDYVWTSGFGGETSKYWSFTEVTSLPITMNLSGGAYYATINLPVAVTIPSGMSAYSATASGDVLSLTRVVENGVLAANQPVILYSESNVTSLTISDASGTSAGDNELSGTTAAVSASGNDYVLGAKNNVVGFYKYTGEVMPGFKAYLPASAKTNNVKAFKFSFDDAEDAIRAIESENSGLEIYDISGRRVQKAQKGLYIVSGKKVLYN